MRFKYIFLLALNILCVCVAMAQTADSILSVTLDDVTIQSYRYSSSVKTSGTGGYVWKLPFLNKLPKIMGNADPVHYAHMLPGVQTNSEYKAGINIQGCENSHNAILIEGVPIYNANHLLGFFSIFNASHFSTMSIDKMCPVSYGTNRIGGILSMQYDDNIPESFEGDVSVGLISSQGSFCLPVGKRTKVTLSLRASYLNLLYGSWLKSDDMGLGYSFADANFTLQHKLNERHSFMIDYYGGYDNGKFDEYDDAIQLNSKWGNQVGAFHWRFNGANYKINSTLYTTNYSNSLQLDMAGIYGNVPSSISDIGIKSFLKTKRWNAGVDIIYHHISPQDIDLKGIYDITHVAPKVQDTWETTLHGEYNYGFMRNFSLNVGSKFVGYFTSNRNFFHVDPSVSLQYDNHTTKVSLNYAYGHQYLFQTGFSNVGLPIEFWLSADENNLPQSAHSLSLSASTSLFGGRYRLAGDLFYKRLYNQIEYGGNIFDVISSSYQLQDNLLHGNGRNYGFSLMLHKCTGDLTGWVSYTYTNARRKFKEMDPDSSFPATHERPHELKAVLMYSPWKHWDFGATAVYASGTPFTLPESIALINGNILTQYGEYNSNRLRPYFRMDISVNYKWFSRRVKEHGINLSLYNVSCMNNHLFWKINVNDDMQFAYRPVSFVVRILPSISYYCKF